MSTQARRLPRRTFLTAGLAMGAPFAVRAAAAEPTEEERANVAVVNAFCAAWAKHDLDRIVTSFADACAYRVTETQEPIKGREAVAARIASFIDRVDRFEVVETFARGPMVFNERHDHFTSGTLRTWHGVGVFFLKGGKIVEWYDYTIATNRR